MNGDLFDTYSIPTSDLLQAYTVTSRWLTDKGRRLYLIPGNHCLSKNSSQISSFELMSRLLIAQFPDKVSYHVGGGWLDRERGVYAISHVPNSDQFDVQLSTVPDSTKFLLVHANLDNQFAAEKIHSLNLTRDQAKKLVKRGITVIMGHEHQGRTILGDKVVVTGNQAPSSVSDCLAHGDAQKDGMKYCLEIDGDDMELIPTWSRTDKVGGYAEIDWECLGKEVDITQGFVRVTGSATAAQSADVIKAISKYRQASNHFVITNAVRIDGLQDMESLAESVEDIRSVNVIDLLLAELSEEQQVVVRKLLEEA